MRRRHIAPALPESLERTGFTVAAARAAGVSPGRLRSHALVTPRRGVRAVDPPRTELESAVAVAPSLRAGQALSGRSAAAVWGLPLPRRLDADRAVEIVSRRGRNVARGVGVRGRRITPSRWRAVEVDGICVLDPSSTWASLSRHLSTDELVVVGDSLLAAADHYPGRRVSGPLASLSELAETVHRWRRSPGIAALASAVELVRPGVESPMETRLRLELVRQGLPEPEINVPVLLPNGRRARLDLAYPSLFVGIEYDGDVHRTNSATFRGDISRREDLADAGWRIIRVTADDLHGAAVTLADRVRRAMARSR